MVARLSAVIGGSSLLELRDEVSRVGRQELGTLNTRPKKLIHVSAMRLLSWPSSLTHHERSHVNQTISRWARALAHGQLTDGSGAPNVGFDGVTATQLELVRDVQWMMTQHHTYANFSLQGAPS